MAVQRVTQQAGQSRHRALRRRRILADECADGVQRVEEKVRLNARFQGGEARLRQQHAGALAGMLPVSQLDGGRIQAMHHRR